MPLRWPKFQQKPGDPRCKDEAERESRRTPWRHAVRTGNQLADSAQHSAAARFFLHFSRAGAANVTHKRYA